MRDRRVQHSPALVRYACRGDDDDTHHRSPEKKITTNPLRCCLNFLILFFTTEIMGLKKICKINSEVVGVVFSKNCQLSRC